MPTVREVVAYLLDNYTDLDVIACAIWTGDDVIDKATKMNLVLSQYEVEEILNRLDDEHNASIGINWDVLETMIQEVNK